ncbi:extracellular solute-binding protein [Actinophytocola sediminis]
MRVGVLGAVAAVAALVTACAAADDGPVTIDLSFAPEASVATIVDDCNARAAGRYEIVHHAMSGDANQQHDELVRGLAARADEMDIVGLDVTWVPEFAEAGWLEEWTGEHLAAAERGVLPGPLETTSWQGRTYAATKNANVQLLWYDRRVVTSPPATWDDLMTQAEGLRTAGKPYRVLFTGAQYEGLVVLYNTLVESAGGHILAEDGGSVAVDAGAVEALAVLREITARGLTDPRVADHKEEEVRQGFQDGQAAFQLNWPYVYAMMAKERPADLRHLGWARYPAVRPGQPSRTTIGGYNVAVGTHSANKPEAFEAALCLRDEANQKFAALRDGLPPTIESIYADDTPLRADQPPDPEDNPTMSSAYPMRDAILDALRDAAVRPQTPRYQQLSTIIAEQLWPPATIDPAVTAERLRDELAAIA